jgi:hypothetical protein
MLQVIPFNSQKRYEVSSLENPSIFLVNESSPLYFFYLAKILDLQVGRPDMRLGVIFLLKLT